MKTTALTLSALAVLMGLAACSKENFNSDPQDGNAVKVTLSANQDSNITRAAIGETTDGKTAVLWSATDELSVFDGANENKEFKLTGESGKTSGTFEGEVGKTPDSYIALYPYQSAASISSDRNTISGVTLKNAQTAVAGSFDPEAALMTAVEADGALAFKNAVGYIKVTPTFACTKITLTSNNSSDALAGTVSISLASDGTPTAAIAADASDASSSVSISGDIKAGSTYYIAVLPKKLTDGFKLIFTNAAGDETSRESSKELEIKRNTITDLGNIEASDLSGTPYITFSASSEQKFKMTLPNTIRFAGTFEYSVDGTAWKTVATKAEVTFGGANGDLRLRGKSTGGTDYYLSSSNEYYSSTISFMTAGVKVKCSGDIRTLVDWENYATVSTANASFQRLFYDCAVLTSAPDLPSTTLAKSCYSWMFYGCTSLESAPALPAGGLTYVCYYEMFRGCTKLTTAPELPAETLAQQCYKGMFYGCTGLTTAPVLPAKTLAKQCYKEMFYGCSRINAVTVKATEITDTYDNCFENWLYQAASSGIIHKRSTLVLSTNSDYGIPSGWTAVDDVTD